MTQNERILQYMAEFGGITPAEAYTLLGCYRLAARIADLRSEGHNITRRIINSTNKYGDKIHYCEYKLERPA